MSTSAGEREQELAWEEWALSRRSRRLKRGRTVIACFLAVLITLISATGALAAPKPSSVAPPDQSIVYTSASAIEDPVFSPDGSHIVFSSSASGNFEIWEATVEGRQPTRLTYLQGDSLHPEFSPDGKSIAFYHVLGNSKTIMTMKSDGSGANVLARNAADAAFAWSPDGRFIAYDAINSTQKQVSVVDVKNGGIVFTTNGSAPAWSQDSHSLVLVAQSNDTASVLAIANMTEGYTHLVNVTGLATYPRFYRNSSSLLFLSFLNDSWGIRIVRLWMNITTLAIASNSDLMNATEGGSLVQTLAPGIGSESIPVANATGSAVIFGAKGEQNGTCLFKVVPHLQVISYSTYWLGTTSETVVSPLTSCDYVLAGKPSWNSEGTQLVFSARNAMGKYDVVLVPYAPQQATPVPYGG